MHRRRSHRPWPLRLAGAATGLLVLLAGGCTRSDAPDVARTGGTVATADTASPGDRASATSGEDRPTAATEDGGDGGTAAPTGSPSPSPSPSVSADGPPATPQPPVPAPTPVPADLDPADAFVRLVEVEVPRLFANPDPDAVEDYYSPDLPTFAQIVAFHVNLVAHEQTARYEQAPTVDDIEVVDQGDGRVVLEVSVANPVLRVYGPDGAEVFSAPGEQLSQRVVLESSTGNWRIAELSPSAAEPPT